MLTFKRVENADREKAENYLGHTFPAECNVYATYEDELVGAGVLTLQGTVLSIAAFRAEPAYTEFTLRSLVYVASNTGLSVEGRLSELADYGFVERDGVYRAKSADIEFPSICKKLQAKRGEQ